MIQLMLASFQPDMIDRVHLVAQKCFIQENSGNGIKLHCFPFICHLLSCKQSILMVYMLLTSFQPDLSSFVQYSYLFHVR